MCSGRMRNRTILWIDSIFSAASKFIFILSRRLPACLLEAVCIFVFVLCSCTPVRHFVRVNMCSPLVGHIFRATLSLHHANKQTERLAVHDGTATLVRNIRTILEICVCTCAIVQILHRICGLPGFDLLCLHLGLVHS